MEAGARSSDFEEYGQGRDRAERFRLILKQARLVLNSHVTEHGCQAEAVSAKI
jgi:hypothetical protein